MFWNFLAQYKNLRKLSRVNGAAGFGLIELLISITVVTLVMGVVLVRQNSFNSAVLLRGQAYEIAFQTREIQLNAVSASADASLGNFRSVQGIYFDKSTGNASLYKIFRDADSDGFFDAGEEFGKQGFLDKRFQFVEFRDAAGADLGSDLAVVFVRPNFDARFFDDSGNEVNTSGVEIDISPKGAVGTGCGQIRTVEITKTGQISVKGC
ncbi:prepilin-type N-terminal cleavage/methylation domain-containing protein [Candidatus Nomurabacteria bacterium]|nr:prepilin-type N-terminal cleavage/methylation domain-containing protein [Candidatus Kaiserbacteria bacterium]MCB9814902.1 prepilin-type N-terminal cleavage/methylation domain-containing protein [Candidatus Nomurabacteria bacterium]